MTNGMIDQLTLIGSLQGKRASLSPADYSVKSSTHARAWKSPCASAKALARALDTLARMRRLLTRCTPYALHLTPYPESF